MNRTGKDNTCSGRVAAVVSRRTTVRARLLSGRTGDAGASERTHG